MIAAGFLHSMAVKEGGAARTWGKARSYLFEPEAPIGLGHDDMQDKMAPKHIAGLQTVRISSCRSLPAEHAVAFAMVAHPRLGEGSVFEGMLAEILQSVMSAARVWPRGRAGEVEGVVRLLGGGLEPRETRTAA